MTGTKELNIWVIYTRRTKECWQSLEVFGETRLNAELSIVNNSESIWRKRQAWICCAKCKHVSQVGRVRSFHRTNKVWISRDHQKTLWQEHSAGDCRPSDHKRWITLKLKLFLRRWRRQKAVKLLERRNKSGVKDSVNTLKYLQARGEHSHWHSGCVDLSCRHRRSRVSLMSLLLKIPSSPPACPHSTLWVCERDILSDLCLPALKPSLSFQETNIYLTKTKWAPLHLIYYIWYSLTSITNLCTISLGKKSQAYG